MNDITEATTEATENTIDSTPLAVALVVTFDAITLTETQVTAKAALWKKIYAIGKANNMSTDDLLLNPPAPKVTKEKVVKLPKAPKVEGDTKPHTLKGTTIPAKYGDGTNTWSGRGLPVAWLREALAKDPTKTKADFLLTK